MREKYVEFVDVSFDYGMLDARPHRGANQDHRRRKVTAPIFDDLVDLAQPESNPEPTTEAKADTNGHWPKVVDTTPDGVMTVQEFADHIKALLVEKLVNEGTPLYEAVASQSRVNTNSVYQYAKRDKNPMPSVLVKTDEEDEGRIYIPTEEATEWWMNRPERGSGVGPDEQDVEKLLYKAGKKADQVFKLNRRLENVQETLDKQTKLRDRYGERLAEVGKTWEEAYAKYQEAVEKDAEKEASESEISDDE